MRFLEALGVRQGDVVAAVGGGGKTFLVYTLAEEAAEAGHTAIVTTTTKMTPPERGPLPPLLLDEDVERLLSETPARLGRERRLLVASGRGNRKRFLPLLPEDVCRLRDAANPYVLAVEADGSAHRPFKAPAAHEPVIPACATVVVACVGLEVVGKPLADRHVHRPELVSALARQEPGSPVEAATVARVLLHEEGGRKGLPAGGRFFVLLNGASPPLMPAAERVLSELAAAAEVEVTALICRRRQADPVVEARVIRGE